MDQPPEEPRQVLEQRGETFPRTVSERHRRDPEQEREDDELHHVAVRESSENVGRNHVEEDFPRGGRVPYRPRDAFGDRLRELHPGPRTQESDGPQPQGERDEVGREEVAQRLPGEPPKRARVRERCEPGEEVEEDERDGGKNQERDEEVAQRLDRGDPLAECGTQGNAGDHTDEDASAQPELHPHSSGHTLTLFMSAVSMTRATLPPAPRSTNGTLPQTRNQRMYVLYIESTVSYCAIVITSTTASIAPASPRAV